MKIITLFVLTTMLNFTSAYGQTVDFKNLTDSVMNGWRADYQRQMTILINRSGCSSSVDLTNLTDSVMNGWRADFQRQMGSLINCIERRN